MQSRSQLANEAFEQSNGDVAKASDILFKRITTDNALHAAYIEPLIREWCADLISAECVRKPRHAIWNASMIEPVPASATTTESNERARNFARSLLDFPLPGGKPLHLASKADVEQAAEFYRKQAEDMAWKARWMQRIAGAMGRKRTVGSAFTAEQLEKLREIEAV